ncbi:MAG: hypothetical protein RLY35_1193 [Bacteroidota bacterium]|jgi:hypothetical protein
MRILVLFLFLIVSSLISDAQWEVNNLINTPVCVEFGKQNDVRILGDDHHGAFLAWKDARNGNNNPDIYVQHVDSLGVMLWETDGKPICIDTSDQSTPNLCTDGNGGFILAWSDRRNGGERDVYVQRISADGNILWTNNGVQVAGKPIREHNEKIASDDNGGAFVVWEQFDSILQVWDIALQRIDANGNLLWNSDGITVTNVTSNKLNPKIQKDKQGGLYVVWQDQRNGLDYDIYVQRLNGQGDRLWGDEGLPVAVAIESQINPKMDPDTLAGGVYVAWADKRNLLDYDIYAQRIDSNGVVLWNNNGIAVCNLMGNQSAVDILSTTQTNGLICTWKDERAGNYDIYAQKLSPSGISVWNENGLLVATSPFNQINPNICSDASDGCIIAWQDSTFNDWDVYAQKITGQGNLIWPMNGAAVSNAIEIQGHPKQVPDGNGGAIFAWQDKRANQYDVYVHHLFADGLPMSIANDEFQNNANWDVFPNPSSGSLTWKMKGMEPIEVKIFSVWGNCIKILPVVSGTSMEFFDLEDGFYFLHEEKTGRTIKWVKQ